MCSEDVWPAYTPSVCNEFVYVNVCVRVRVCVCQEIERLKNERPTWERRTRWAGLRSVFGGQPSLMWMSPFAGLKLPTFLPKHTWRGGAEFSVWQLSLRHCTLKWTKTNRNGDDEAVSLHLEDFLSCRNQLQTLLQCPEATHGLPLWSLTSLLFYRVSIVRTGSKYTCKSDDCRLMLLIVWRILKHRFKLKVECFSEVAR